MNVFRVEILTKDPEEVLRRLDEVRRAVESKTLKFNQDFLAFQSGFASWQEEEDD